MADPDEVLVTIDESADPAISGGDDPAKVLAQQYKDLAADNEREKSRREAAEKRERAARVEADTARREATAAHTNVIESQYDTVVQGLAAAQAEASQAEQEYQAAFEKGDGAAMAKAQRKIANAAARELRFDEAKAELEVRKKEAPRQQTRETRPPARTEATDDDDPVETYVRGRTKPTSEWLRAHPEWITDPRKNAKLSAAHLDAVAEGIATDTKEYFEHVESFIGLRRAANGSGNGHDTTVEPKRKATAPMAAPVHQSSGGTNGGSREVRLTPGEAAAAKDGTHVWNYDDPSPQKRFKKGDPIGIQEFARRKLEMKREGRYDRSYTEG